MPLNNDNEEEKKLNDERYNPYFNFQFSLFVKYKDIDNITIIKHLSEKMLFLKKQFTTYHIMIAQRHVWKYFCLFYLKTFN